MKATLNIYVVITCIFLHRRIEKNSFSFFICIQLYSPYDFNLQSFIIEYKCLIQKIFFQPVNG